jgi:ribonuclease HII
MIKITIKIIEEEIKNLDVYNALEKIYHFERLAGKEFLSIKKKYEKRKFDFEKEVERIKNLHTYENRCYLESSKYIAGIDEVGRGPLAGSVVSAAVILPKDIFLDKINDSKKISYKVREKLYDEIMEKAISVGIGIVNEHIIDEINILNATKMAATEAINNLYIKPDMLLIDAFKLEKVNIRQKSIIRGDSKSISIAAASIIAKVTRDRMMEIEHIKYPEYGFNRNMGYGTAEHIMAIKKHGAISIHRRTFIKNFV